VPPTPQPPPSSATNPNCYLPDGSLNYERAIREFHGWSLARLAEALGYQQSGRGYAGSCTDPSHPDDHASCSLTEYEGRYWLNCFTESSGGCTWQERWRGAWDITGLTPPPPAHSRGRGRKKAPDERPRRRQDLEQRYPLGAHFYHNPAGHPYVAFIRYARRDAEKQPVLKKNGEPKTESRQFHAHEPGRDQWFIGRGGRQPYYPYDIHRLQKLPPGAHVCWFEGETCVDAVRVLRLAGIDFVTTIQGGAKFVGQQDLAPVPAGLQHTVFADADGAGRTCAEDLAERLLAECAPALVRVSLRPAGADPNDIADVLDPAVRRQTLEAWAEAAIPYDPQLRQTERAAPKPRKAASGEAQTRKFPECLVSTHPPAWDQWGHNPMAVLAVDIATFFRGRWRCQGRGAQDAQWWIAGALYKDEDDAWRRRSYWEEGTWEQVWTAIKMEYMPALKQALDAQNAGTLSYVESKREGKDGDEIPKERSVYGLGTTAKGSEQVVLRGHLEAHFQNEYPPRRADWCVPLPNGIVDLRNKTLRVEEFDPTRHFPTGCLALPLTNEELAIPPEEGLPGPDGRLREWQEVLDELMHIPAVRRTFEYLFGAGLCKQIMKVYVQVVGLADSGKTTLPHAVLAALGHLGIMASRKTLEYNDSENYPDLYKALQRDAALMLIDDVKKVRVDVDQLKQITSRTSLSVATKYKDTFEAPFLGLLFITGNARFEIKDMDEGVEVRQLTIDWNRKMAPSQIAKRKRGNKTLIDRIRKIQEGGEPELLKQIVHWLVWCAWRAYNHEPPPIPQEFLEAADKALEVQDPIRAALKTLEDLIDGKPKTEIEALLSQEMEDYESVQPTPGAFTNYMQDAGFENVKKYYQKKSQWCWCKKETDILQASLTDDAEDEAWEAPF